MKSTADPKSPSGPLYPRLIVCDLDGTLLNDDQKISEYTLDVFKRARERGMKICLASGRANQMMTLFQDPYLPCDYHISFNGGTVEDIRQHRVLFQKCLTRESAGKVMAYAAEQALVLTLYSGDRMYYSQGVTKLVNRIDAYEKLASDCGVPAKINASSLGFEDYARVAAEKDLVKIVIYEDDPVKTRSFEDFVQAIPSICTESTGYGLTGVFDKDVSKKTALEWLGESLAIEETDICSFGDYDNDISLFEASGISVAVENATDLVKSHAMYQTQSNNQDGVAQFIEKYLLKY